MKFFILFTCLLNTVVTSLSSKTLGNIKALVVPIAGKNVQYTEPSTQDWDFHFNNIKNVFYENSGGKYNISFEKRPTYITDLYSDKTCNTGPCPGFRDSGWKAIKGIDTTKYDNVIFYNLDLCKCNRFFAFAYTCSKFSWAKLNLLERKPQHSVVIVHEIGHNMCFGHSGHRQMVYGNSYSPMGNKILISNHFMVGAKLHAQWINSNSVIKIEKPHSGNYWIYSSDTGKYNNDLLYGIQIKTPNEDNFIWVECRTKYYPELKGKAIVYASRYNRYFGQSRLFDYKTVTGTVRDVGVPLGKTFVVNLYNTGLVLKVLKIEPEKIYVSVNFIKTEQEKDYTKGLEQLFCSQYHTFKLNEKFKLFYMTLDQPSILSSEIISCYHDVYIYPEYPASFFIDNDPEINAILKLSKTCSTKKIYVEIDNIQYGGSVFKNFNKNVYILFIENTNTLLLDEFDQLENTESEVLYTIKTECKNLHSTLIPTKYPTVYPTKIPTGAPIKYPTLFPATSYPTEYPIVYPTLFPTMFPSSVPTKITNIRKYCRRKRNIKRCKRDKKCRWRKRKNKCVPKS